MISETPQTETPQVEAQHVDALDVADGAPPEADEAAVDHDEAVAEDAEPGSDEDDGAPATDDADAEPGDFDDLRLVEALLFASAEPLAPAQLARFLPEDVDLDRILGDLQSLYANRGVNLVKRGGRWAFRTAEDLAPRMELENRVVRKLSRVALETLAVIAYHQPVTRAEIEEIRGVALSKGTLDALLEIGWIRPKGRRRTPGRPVTWGTSDAFLDHFGLEGLDALPGVEELKAAGLLDARPALTALGDRGLLPAAGEVEPEEVDDEDEETEDSDEELLEATFGEDLLPQEVDLTTTPRAGAADESADDGAGEATTAVTDPAFDEGEGEGADNEGPGAADGTDGAGDAPRRSTG